MDENARAGGRELLCQNVAITTFDTYTSAGHPTDNEEVDNESLLKFLRFAAAQTNINFKPLLVGTYAVAFKKGAFKGLDKLQISDLAGQRVVFLEDSIASPSLFALQKSLWQKVRDLQIVSANSMPSAILSIQSGLALGEYALRQNVPLVHLVDLVFKFLLLVERRHLARLGEPSGDSSGLLDPLRNLLEATAVPEYVEQPVELRHALLQRLGEQRHLHKDNTNCLCQLEAVYRELVGVPAVLCVATGLSSLSNAVSVINFSQRRECVLLPVPLFPWNM